MVAPTYFPLSTKLFNCKKVSRYVCSMYFIYIMYSERAKSKIVCEETIPFWELECGKYLSYLFHSNNYYKICVLCCISWLPTHQVLNKLKQKNQGSSYKQLACYFCFCYDLMLMGHISPQAGFCQCPNFAQFLKMGDVQKEWASFPPHTIIWCGCCCWCGGVLLFYIFQ